MKKWENECPNCGSTNITEDAVDIYYGRNPSVYHCDDCGAEITIKMVPTVDKVTEKK